MLEIFKEYIRSKSSVNEEELKQIEALCQVKRLRRRQYLLQEGDVWKYNAFVTKGCLRTYTIDEKGNEHIISFAIENWWIGDRESLASGQPSIFNIDALEEAEVVLISKANFENLCANIPALNEMVHAILQRSFIVAQKRIHTFISLSAEEKYLAFAERYPQLLTRLPQGMIASYLGITPETLSRVRKQTARKS